MLYMNETVTNLLKFIGQRYGRDEKWKQETIKNTSEQQFRTEFECEFLGSVDTLVNSAKLRTMSHITPIQSNAGLDIYEARKNIVMLLQLM